MESLLRPMSWPGGRHAGVGDQAAGGGHLSKAIGIHVVVQVLAGDGKEGIRSARDLEIWDNWDWDLMGICQDWDLMGV